MYGLEGSLVGEVNRAHLHGLFDDLAQPTKLGSGAYGEVWKARWTPTDDERKHCGLPPLPPTPPSTQSSKTPPTSRPSLDVAVKTMRMSDVAHKWDRELSVLRSLPRHPYVLRVYGYARFVHDGWERLALVMELGEHDLTHEVPKAEDGSTNPHSPGRLKEPQGVTAELHRQRTLLSLIQLADALSFCHAHDILHRDVKPHNFIRLKRNKGTVAVLTDFGESRMVPNASKDSGLTHKVGAPRYMAPEVAEQVLRGIPMAVYSSAADVYSFGVSMSELLPRSRMIKHFPEGVPDMLHELIKRCTDEQPKRRPTMKAVLNQLEHALQIARICRLSPAEIISESYWELLHSGRRPTLLDAPLNRLLTMVSTIDDDFESSTTSPTNSATVSDVRVRMRSVLSDDYEHKSVSRVAHALEAVKEAVKEAAMPTPAQASTCHYDQLVARYLGELFIRCAKKERFTEIIAKAIGQPYSPDLHGVVGFISEQLTQLDDLAREHEEARVVQRKLVRTIQQESAWKDIHAKLKDQLKKTSTEKKVAASSSSAPSSPSDDERSVLVQLKAISVDSVKSVIQREVDRMHDRSGWLGGGDASTANDADKVVDSFSRIFAPLYMIFIRVGRFSLSLPPSLTARATRYMARFSFAPWHLLVAALVEGKAKGHKLWERAAFALAGLAVAPFALLAMFPTALGKLVHAVQESAWRTIYERANHSLLQAATCVLTSIDGVEDEVKRRIERFNALDEQAKDHSDMQWFLIRTLAAWATESKVESLINAHTPAMWYDCFRPERKEREEKAPTFILSKVDFHDEGGDKIPFKDRWRWIKIITTVVALKELRDLQVQHGAKLVVCGPQQSGKTTLVKLLRRKKPPTEAVHTRFPIASLATIGSSSYQLMDLPGFDDLTTLGPTILAHSLQHVKGIVFVCSLDNCNNEKLPNLFRILAATIPSHCRILFCINKVEQQLINGRVDDFPPQWPTKHTPPPDQLLDKLVAPRIRDVLRVQREVFPHSLMEIRVVQINCKAGMDSKCTHLLRRQKQFTALRDKVWSFKRIRRWIEDNCPAWAEGDELEVPAGGVEMSPRKAFDSDDEADDELEDEEEVQVDEDGEERKEAAFERQEEEEEGVYQREDTSLSRSEKLD